jgi:MoaA/NifB/PqqE/SkfB family radical SAM enzyme
MIYENFDEAYDEVVRSKEPVVLNINRRDIIINPIERGLSFKVKRNVIITSEQMKKLAEKYELLYRLDKNEWLLYSFLPVARLRRREFIIYFTVLLTKEENKSLAKDILQLYEGFLFL